MLPLCFYFLHLFIKYMYFQGKLINFGQLIIDENVDCFQGTLNELNLIEKKVNHMFIACIDYTYIVWIVSVL